MPPRCHSSPQFLSHANGAVRVQLQSEIAMEFKDFVAALQAKYKPIAQAQKEERERRPAQSSLLDHFSRKGNAS